jgi:hypothetical protein
LFPLGLRRFFVVRDAEKIRICWTFIAGSFQQVLPNWTKDFHSPRGVLALAICLLALRRYSRITFVGWGTFARRFWARRPKLSDNPAPFSSEVFFCFFVRYWDNRYVSSRALRVELELVFD